MKCKQCGKSMKFGLNKCPSCNTFVEESVNLGAMSAMKSKKEKKPKAKLCATDMALRISLSVVSVITVVGILFGMLYIYARSMITENAHIDEKFTEEEKQEMHINTELPTAAEGIVNIALFGLDERGETGELVDASGKGKSFHSDAIIILTIDRRDKKNPSIKMTSIARDTLVYVEGYNSVGSKTKLTHAFQFGYNKAKNADATTRAEIRKKYKGDELKGQLAQLEANYKREGAKTAIATINQNFNLNIEEYMYVNFVEFMDIIDYVGGVTITVQSRELKELNKHIGSMRVECDRDIPTVQGAGTQTLTGGQALAYSRIRKIDSDLKRANRQKEVLMSLFGKVKETPVNKLPDVIGKLLSMCHTTLTAEQILEMGTWAVTNSPAIDNFTMPPENADGDWVWGGTHENYGWVWIYDLDYASQLMIDFIFSDVSGDKVPKPTMAPDLVTTKKTQADQTTGTVTTTATTTVTTTVTGTSTGVSSSTVTGSVTVTDPSSSGVVGTTAPIWWTTTPSSNTDSTVATQPSGESVTSGDANSTAATLPSSSIASGIHTYPTRPVVSTDPSEVPTEPSEMPTETVPTQATRPTISIPNRTTAVTEPSVTEPSGTEPSVTEPSITEPTTAPADVTTAPTDSTTATTETTTTATEPTATEPTATEPVETEPTATEPIATEPVETEPTATEPTTTEPTTAPTETTAPALEAQP